MAPRDRLQHSRFELKYIVDEQTANAVCDYLRPRLVPDDHLRPEQKIGYAIYSIYFDTPHRKLYTQTVRGIATRYKLRMRFYDDLEDSPVFAEIKHRKNSVIQKERAAVDHAGAKLLLHGECPSMDYLFNASRSGKVAGALRNFCNLRDKIGARPTTFIRYNRLAYMTPENNSVRVTFDRELAALPYELKDGIFVPDKQGLSKPDIGGVVLEFKFTDTFPLWLKTVAEMFNLERTSVPKYVASVDKLQPDIGSWLQLEID